MKRSKIAAVFFWAMAARLGGLALAVHVLAMAPSAQAQGSRKDDIVFNSRGVPLAGATVRVCAMPASGQPCTPLAQIFSDAALTQALANPTTTDGLGNYFFYAAPGKYEIEFSGPGITTKQIPNVILPSDPTAPSFSSVSSTGAISAFSLNLTGNLTVNGNTTVVGNLASGTLNLINQSTPPGAAGSGTVNLYTKTTDKRLYYKDDTGAEIGPVANTTGAQTNVTNSFTAQQNFDANVAFKGPNPSFDITRFGGYSAASPPSTTGSISSGTATLTLAVAQDFANGQGIVVYGAGAAPTITTPGTPTVTPIGVLNGATTYNYKVIAEDRLGGLTAASTQGSTTTGAATLGVNTVTLTQGVRASGITTYTSSTNHNLQVGATVNIAGFNSGSGTFFDDMNGVKVVVSTPTGTTFTVNDATFADRTDSSGGTAQVQACNQLSYASSSFSGAGTLRYWVYRNNALVGVVPGMDPFYIDCNLTVGSPPSYVPAAPPGAATPQYLVSTIVSGGGTTTLTVANNASTTVSGKAVLHDNSLPLKAAAQAAYNVGGGTVYIPIGAFAANYPFNATTDFTSGMTVSGSFSVRVLIAAALLFNQPIIPRSAMDFEGTPSTTSSFVYVNGGSISGLAHPLIYTGEGVSGVHFNRLLFTIGQALQAGFFSDNGTDGGGTSGMVFDDVQFLGNNGNTRPVVLKGGFDYFFRRGECSSGGATWPVTPCMELTNSSPALVGASASQIPGRVEWNGGTFVNTGVYINGLPNSAFSGATHIAFSRVLFESAVAPFARINMNNSGGFTSQYVFNDMAGADLAVPLATPFIDGTNSPNLQRVSWLDGSTAVSNEPLYVNGTPGTATTFYVARPPSSVITNVPYTSTDTASAQYSNSFASALNGGRFFYQMTTPSAPGVAVSAGGSVPVGAQQYQITAVDPDGKESVISSIATATTSSGNQTVTVTPPTLPPGAVAWKAYRNQVLANIPGCSTIAPGMTFVDTFSFTCGNSVPVAQAGSSILSNTGIHASSLTSGNYNGARVVCNASGASVGWAGADVSAWINNAIADIVANSGGKGTVDARSCTGNQTISQEIDVGNNAATTLVTLLLPNSGPWNITITDGVSCGIKQFNQSSIRGDGVGVGGSLRITGSASANLSAFYCTDPSPVAGGSYIRAEDFSLYNPNGSTVSVALMNVQKVFDNSTFSRILVNNSSATDGLRVYAACCGTSFYNITSNSNGGKRPVFVQADASATNSDVSFYSLSADHPGSGFASVEISGTQTPGTVTDGVNRKINFYGLYTEDTAGNPPDIGVKIIDARGVDFFGWRINGSSNASYVGLDISQTVASQVKDVDVYGLSYLSAGGTGINNHITGHTEMTSTRYKSHYYYGGSVGNQVAMPTTIEDNELDINDASGVLQYQFPTNGAAVFSGSPVARAIASGTSTLGSSAIASLTCATVVTTAASGAAITDAVEWAFASAPATADGLLEVTSYVTSGNVNWKVCNPTSSSQTPSGLVVNWRVVR